MIALQIQDVKDFMSKLLIGNAFDAFWLSEVAITTFTTFHIDGVLHPDFLTLRKRKTLLRKGENMRSGKISNHSVSQS